LRQLHAVEAVQEVDVPPVTAELAVGDRRDADRLLQRDHVADAAVLHCVELGRGDLAFLRLGARLMQLVRTQQTADVVRSEWRFHAAAAVCLTPAPALSASALSMASQVNSGSSRPKWP